MPKPTRPQSSTSRPKPAAKSARPSSRPAPRPGSSPYQGRAGQARRDQAAPEQWSEQRSEAAPAKPARKSAFSAYSYGSRPNSKPRPVDPEFENSAAPAKPRASKTGPAKSSAPRFSPAGPTSSRSSTGPSSSSRPNTARPSSARSSSSSPDQRPRPTQARTTQGRPAQSRPAQARPRPTAAPVPAREPATPLPKLPVPFAVVSRRASDSLRRGHLWVYSSEIEQIETGPGDPPALVPVVDTRGLLLGTALYSPISQISLRLVSRDHLDHEQWLSQLATRLRTAISRRKPLLTEATNACRLVFSEADDLPGLIVDKYADIVILQLLAKGLDSAEVRTLCTKILREELLSEGGQLTIWERPDPRIRELEGLSAPVTTPLFSTNPDAPTSSTTFLLNGFSFQFDANSGQKTGAFLDQRENYAAAAAWARIKGATGKALDVCTYQGGFALHLAQVCEHVTGLDASRSSLEVAEKNLEANRSRIPSEIDWLEADAFELLRAWAEPKSGSEADRSWDVIVLDPPAFAKSKRAVEGALRGYKELNLRALRMLRPGGLLITCSCSHHISLQELEAAVADAAVDAHRRVTLLERRGAAQDHPVLFNLPETEYLKCLICQVD
ncbi:class I SAM-dependent rRNA methyltransferase [Acidicapsa ligni]|uniref:class I SAM-dependent rRNA methyltransferase n=1 Tax=Acidicapsa ligni TaxID=542300 RepID=UPI0021E04949|nr:class I SAM-dependent methyltransferase [Acidicapsa ligni]